MAYNYEYPRPAVTADCVVITNEPVPKVLFIQRGNNPFKGSWALPGGFMEMNETLDQCAIRELKEETGLQLSECYQVGAYSGVSRDPRTRVITAAYLFIVPELFKVEGRDDAADAQWFPITDLPHLAFDHYDIVRDAVRLYARVVNPIEKVSNK